MKDLSLCTWILIFRHYVIALSYLPEHNDKTTGNNSVIATVMLILYSFIQRCYTFETHLAFLYVFLRFKLFVIRSTKFSILSHVVMICF